MTTFKLVLRARKAGSIGVFGERREYEIQAADRDAASRIAIERASNEGRTLMLTAIVLVCSVALSVQDCDCEHAQYRSHFGDMIGETGDAITGDVLLQLSLLGEVVYG
jgi:hypothetical protein